MEDFALTYIVNYCISDSSKRLWRNISVPILDGYCYEEISIYLSRHELHSFELFNR